MEQLERVIREVHRRSLWQVLLIYAGGAWAAYEVIDTITDRLTAAARAARPGDRALPALRSVSGCGPDTCPGLRESPEFRELLGRIRYPD